MPFRALKPGKGKGEGKGRGRGRRRGRGIEKPFPLVPKFDNLYRASKKVSTKKNGSL